MKRLIGAPRVDSQRRGGGIDGCGQIDIVVIDEVMPAAGAHIGHLGGYLAGKLGLQGEVVFLCQLVLQMLGDSRLKREGGRTTRGDAREGIAEDKVGLPQRGRRAGPGRDCQ